MKLERTKGGGWVEWNATVGELVQDRKRDVIGLQITLRGERLVTIIDQTASEVAGGWVAGIDEDEDVVTIMGTERCESYRNTPERTLAGILNYIQNTTEANELCYGHVRTLLEQDGYKV